MNDHDAIRFQLIACSMFDTTDKFRHDGSQKGYILLVVKTGPGFLGHWTTYTLGIQLASSG